MAKRNIYLDADTIFDTRLALLLRLDPATAKRIAHKYDTRETDRFADPESTFTQEDWEKSWALRDANLLRESIMTNGLRLLAKTIANINWEQDLDQAERTVEVTLNLWPYQLTEPEKKAICEAVSLHLPLKVAVNSCFIPLELLSFVDAKERWELMIGYNTFDWLKAREKELETNDAPNLMLVVPRLYRGDPAAESELIKTFQCFNLSEMLSFGKFQLRFIEVKDFCAIRA